MENINDTPARFEENQDYLRDPLSTTAKPYSTKQQQANEEHASKVWLYNKDGGKLFSRDEAEEAMKDGWKPEPYKKAKEEKPVEDAELKALREEAKDMGVKVDKRWNKKRLMEEMEKHG